MTRPSKVTSLLQSLIMLCPVLLLSAPSYAERADRDKPVNVEADRVTVDDLKQIATFEGRVTLTQGTLILRGEKIVVYQDAEGFQKGIATGAPARFRTKREGSDEYVDGEAERIEYDGNSETAQLFNRAFVKSGQDEIRGQHIHYDTRTEQYAVNSNAGSSKVAGDTRVRAVIVPKKGPESLTPSVPEAPLKSAPQIANSPRE